MACFCRRAIRLSGYRHNAAHRLRIGIVAHFMRQRPPLAEAGNRDIDDIWLEGADVFVSDLPLVQRAGSKVLQYNISAAGELAEDVLSTRMVEIERNRFLVTVN